MVLFCSSKVFHKQEYFFSIQQQFPRMILLQWSSPWRCGPNHYKSSCLTSLFSTLLLFVLHVEITFITWYIRELQIGNWSYLHNQLFSLKYKTTFFCIGLLQKLFSLSLLTAAVIVLDFHLHLVLIIVIATKPNSPHSWIYTWTNII